MTELQIDDAAFLGKLTAGATHEIRNVLSVIKESAGLMEDLLELANGESFEHAEKFRKMTANILGQVDRGSSLVKELNTLAHTTDDRVRSVDVQKVLLCLCALYARFCRQKEINLTSRLSDSEVFIVTDPVRLHAAVCAVIDVLLEEAPQGSELSITSESGDRVIEVLFSVASDKDLSPKNQGGEGIGEKVQRARSIAEALGGSVEIGVREWEARLILPREHLSTK